RARPGHHGGAPSRRARTGRRRARAVPSPRPRGEMRRPRPSGDRRRAAYRSESMAAYRGEMRLAACALLAALVTTPVAGAAHTDRPAATKRIVRAWSAHLNAYDNAGLARLFARPAVFAQGGIVLRLETYADIALWHSLLPCAGRIVSITVKGETATAVFVSADGHN